MDVNEGKNAVLLLRSAVLEAAILVRQSWDIACKTAATPSGTPLPRRRLTIM